VSFIERYSMAAAFGRSLPIYCSARGINLSAEASIYDIELESFNDTGRFISLVSFGKLLEHLATITCDDLFGLKYGVEFRLGNSGAFGLGLMNAPTFGDAIKFYARYIPLTADYAYFNANIGSKSVDIEWGYSPLIIKTEQYADLMTVLTIRQFRFFTGSLWTPSSARLERREPTSRFEHTRHISPKLEFESKGNGISFPSNLVPLENSKADHRLFELMERQCDYMLSQRENIIPFPIQVYEEILLRLASENISLAEVAKFFCMSERNLQRRLSKSGKNFEALLDEARKELSNQLLRETELSLTDISQRLGYLAPNSYSRAAKLWHQQAPSMVRQNMKSSCKKDSAHRSENFLLGEKVSGKKWNANF
jgi:AraC-like DNA-binding protein